MNQAELDARRGHGKSAHGGKPAGRRVRVPRGAEEPIKVFVNGLEQRRGEDYKLVDGFVVFAHPVLKEDLSELSGIRKVALGLGLVGSYQRNETVDIEYALGGRREFASDLPVLPD